jgi:hypothetical protein
METDIRSWTHSWTVLALYNHHLPRFRQVASTPKCHKPPLVTHNYSNGEATGLPLNHLSRPVVLCSLKSLPMVLTLQFYSHSTAARQQLASRQLNPHDEANAVIAALI